MSKLKKCLVLGANGFIGSHLVDKLINEGYDVVAFDRFRNPPKFNDSPRIEKVKGDIFNHATIKPLIERVDFVFHCYSATTPSTSDDDPYIDITANLLNNIKIIEACANANIKKFIYLSSGGAIYGQGGSKESDVTLPISPYGISKFATERYLAYFKVKLNQNYIVYRLSNPYGPRQVTKHNQGVIPRFIHHIASGQPITIYGDGTASRDYIYIEDAADIMVDTFNKSTKHDVYNLGSGHQTSLIDIVRAIEDVCGLKATIQYIDAPETFVKVANLDTSRIQKEFDVEIKTSFQAGLRKTLNSN